MKQARPQAGRDKALSPLARLMLGLTFLLNGMAMAETNNLLLDDFSTADGYSSLGTPWQGFTDRVMGGISDISAKYVETDDGTAVRMTGSVRLENNGGFIQLRLPLSSDGGDFDLSNYSSVRLTTRGQPGSYYIHLRTGDNRRPWQYYSAKIKVGSEWTVVDLPFSAFQAQGTRTELNLSQARSIAIVAYGERFEADIEVARIELISDQQQN